MGVSTSVILGADVYVVGSDSSGCRNRCPPEMYGTTLLEVMIPVLSQNNDRCRFLLSTVCNTKVSHGVSEP